MHDHEGNSWLLPTENEKRRKLEFASSLAVVRVCAEVGLDCVCEAKECKIMRDFFTGTSMCLPIASTLQKPESKNLDIRQTWKCHSQRIVQIHFKSTNWMERDRKNGKNCILRYSWFRTLRQSINCSAYEEIKTEFVQNRPTFGQQLFDSFNWPKIAFFVRKF